MDAENILAKVSENLSVRRAFGAAYEKNGVLIIPVALVAGGGGGGTSRARPGNSAAHADGSAEPDATPQDSGPMEAGRTDAGRTDAGRTDAGRTDAGRTDAERTDAGRTDAGRTDAGGGFGGLVMPAGAYVVKGDQVRWVPAVDVTIVVLASLSLVRILTRAWSRRRRSHGQP
jgi:uncharacterized spore protein YtfJ